MKRFLEKIQEMRFLPVFVVLSMVIGIAIGKWYGISNFELTPPIDAIKSIFHGTYQFNLANSLALGVVIGLFLMIYPAMTNVKVEDMGKAARSPMQLLIVLFFNYLVAPFFMLLLARVFLAGDHDLYVGLVLYGLAPCIAMVIVFTFLSLGNNALAIILVAINSVCQMLLIPVYAKLLLGEVTFDVLVVGESVLLYLGLPLVAGFLTRRIAVSRMGEEGFKEFKTYLDSLSIVGLLFTLIVMFALKGDLILERPLIILQMAVPMTIFFWVMYAVVYLAGLRRAQHGDRHRHRKMVRHLQFRAYAPIDAIKSIFHGTYQFTLANSLALGVVIGLFLMIYPAMTNVKIEDMGKAARSPRQLLIVLFFNYLVAPFFMLFLAKVFLAGDHDLYVGLVLYGLAPCIAMVIVFTFLSLGNNALAIILVAINSVCQMLLIPVYAKLLLGEVTFDVLVVGESVLLYLGLPLVAGFLTRRIAVSRMGEEGFKEFKTYLDSFPSSGFSSR